MSEFTTPVNETFCHSSEIIGTPINDFSFSVVKLLGEYLVKIM